MGGGSSKTKPEPLSGDLLAWLSSIGVESDCRAAFNELGVKTKADLEMVKKAYVFAATSHEGQTRRSGEPYIMHPLAVADLIADLRLDDRSICAALLHDTVEDTTATYEDLEVLFSREVADLVDGVTKLGNPVRRCVL